MITFSRRAVRLMIAALVFGVGLGAVLEFTEVCRIEAVTLDGKAVVDWPERYGLRTDRPMFRQSVDSLAEAILNRSRVFRVSVEYSLPRELEIRINDFNPVCYLVDKVNGKIYGLSKSARVIPLSPISVDWERPIITGGECGKLYDHARDPRVNVIVDQLELVAGKHGDFFRLIEEIDISRPTYIKLRAAGLAYCLKVHAQTLCDDISRFLEFLTRYRADLQSIKAVDLRFENMIICVDGD